MMDMTRYFFFIFLFTLSLLFTVECKFCDSKIKFWVTIDGLNSKINDYLEILGVVFAIPHQLAKLFMAEESIINLIKTVSPPSDAIEEYQESWESRYNELEPRADKLKLVSITRADNQVWLLLKIWP